MKRVILTSIFFTICLVAQSQSKIDVKNGFWVDTYSIDGEKKSEKDVMLYLKQYNSESYYQFRSGRNNDVVAFIGSIVSLGGATYFLVADSGNKSGKKVAAIGTGLGLGVSLLFSEIGARKKRKAIDIYNSGN